MEEIIDNYIKEMNLTPEKLGEMLQDTVALKQLQSWLSSMITFIGYDESNPNYSRNSKFFPKSIDKSLVRSEGGDLSKVPWFTLKGTKQATITRKAIQSWAKKHGIELDIKKAYK